MLWRRHCMAESVRKHKRVACLSMNASFQESYKYLAMIEEIMEREQPVRVLKALEAVADLHFRVDTCCASVCVYKLPLSRLVFPWGKTKSFFGKFLMLDFICISSGCVIKQSLMEVDIGFSMAAAGPSGEIFLAPTLPTLGDYACLDAGCNLCPWHRC